MLPLILRCTGQPVPEHDLSLRVTVPKLRLCENPPCWINNYCAGKGTILDSL